MSVQSQIDRINGTVSEQSGLIQQIKAALEGKASGGTEPIIEPLSVKENGTYTAPDGVHGYSPVTVNVPTGTTETWTFLMEDGSEVTKDVVVA